MRHDSWPKVGDIVLIKDEGPKNRSKMGQVIELHTGEDSIPRVATVRTNQGQLMRPVVKLYPLELHQEIPTKEPEEKEEAMKSVRPKRKTAQAAAESRKTLIKAGQL